MSCSCLIARNLMSGLKSCSEIFKYMHHSEKKIFSRDGDGMALADGCLKADGNETVVSLFVFVHTCTLNYDLVNQILHVHFVRIGWWCTKKIEIFT